MWQRKIALVITHLAGLLAHTDVGELSVEIDVGGGVRYEVRVPAFLWPEIQAVVDAAPEDGPTPEISLHVLYHATANTPVPLLVGFLRRPERDFFRKFTSVEGLGPVKAVKAMNLSVSTIARAIEQEDRATLTRLPGVGPRVADKIIAALRGKVVAEAALRDGALESPVDLASLERDRVALDAVEAIAALGYARSEARRWVDDALAAAPGIETVEELTLAVLRARGG